MTGSAAQSRLPRSCAVAIIGAGPIGLCLAGELSRFGVESVLLERRAALRSGSRAIGLHPPALRALEASGATERILDRAARITAGIARLQRGGGSVREIARVSLATADECFPFVASLPQAETEAVLARNAPAVVHGTEVTGLTSFPGEVRVETQRGELSAGVVVIAAGVSGRTLARPFVRYRGRQYPDRYLMADLPGRLGAGDADRDGELGTARLTLGSAGVVESFPLPNGGRRLVAWDGSSAPSRPGPERVPDHRDSAQDRAKRLRDAVADRAGEHDWAERVRDASTFGIRRCLAERLRRGRVFIIGDAAHEISPIGGQGMNLGILDAVSLAPLLARAIDRGAVSDTGSGFDRGADPALDRWEDRRLASALTAARIAGINTAAGRGKAGGTVSAGARSFLLSCLFSRPLADAVRRTAARAYTMGFDRESAAYSAESSSDATP